MDKVRFGMRLRELREKQSISCRSLSLSLGRNSSYISKIESGRALPSVKVFVEICGRLNISPAGFFEYEQCEELDFKNVITLAKELNDEQLNLVVSCANQFVELNNKKVRNHKSEIY